MDLINKNHKLNLINQKDQILLSFSGGQDSISLLFMLNQLYSQLELHITLFWCHHLWQTDSFYLMQQIAKLSFLFQFNSCFAIPSNSLSSELLARKWRQSCSYRVSLFYNDSKICLAHTFNDKVETIFFNFMRGTGLTKLSPLRREQLIYKSNSTNEKHVFRHQYIYLGPNILLCLTPSSLCLLRTRRNTLKGSAKPMQGSPAHLKNRNITEQAVKEFRLLCYAKNCYDFDSSLLLQICDFAMQNLNLYNKPKELFLLRSNALLVRSKSLPSFLLCLLRTRRNNIEDVSTNICLASLPFPSSSMLFLRVRSKQSKKEGRDLLLYPLGITSKTDVSVKQEGKGAAGIKTQKGIARPLLSISRFEIKKICFFWKLPLYPDTSNQKVKFLRNRVRRQLLPTIKFFFNSKIENIFLQLAEIVETEDYRFTQIVNEFTKNIDVYDAKLQIHPTFTLLDKKRISSNFVPPIKKNSSRAANVNAINDLSLPRKPFALLGVQKSRNLSYPSCFAPKMNLQGACETEKSIVCLLRTQRNPVGISNAKPTASVMAEFKNLKFLDLLIQLIEINRFNHNVSLLTKLIDKIASQKNELRDPKLNKRSVFCCFETYHLTHLDIKKLKKKFAKEPTKIINENILAITPP